MVFIELLYIYAVKFSLVEETSFNQMYRPFESIDTKLLLTTVITHSDALIELN
jgi:hypothetical protein